MQTVFPRSAQGQLRGSTKQRSAPLRTASCAPRRRVGDTVRQRTQRPCTPIRPECEKEKVFRPWTWPCTQGCPISRLSAARGHAMGVTRRASRYLRHMRACLARRSSPEVPSEAGPLTKSPIQCAIRLLCGGARFSQRKFHADYDDGPLFAAEQGLRILAPEERYIAPLRLRAAPLLVPSIDPHAVLHSQQPMAIKYCSGGWTITREPPIRQPPVSFDRRSNHSFAPRRLAPPLTIRNWAKEVVWFNLGVVTLTPLISLYGLITTRFDGRTAWFCVAYYVFNMIGITAGYHRLWSHRSYRASTGLQILLAMAGAGAVQGSVKWWARHHRAHHRYTDTDLDPYGAHLGLWHSHIGWMLTKPRVRHGPADTSDLRQNRVVAWQHRWFFVLAFVFGLAVPALVPALCWDDARGGLFFAGFLRLTAVHHSTFSVNSLAHWLGSSTFDDKLTPRDHLLTALVTLGEGYHNFHHQFPMDYRNAIQWYQWDPTKWFIAACAKLGLASHLLVFPGGEIRKSELTMKIKQLKREQDRLEGPSGSEDLPVVDWDTFTEQAQGRPLIVITGFVHDVGRFMEEHPGGRGVLEKHVGRDATTAFLGGVYDHSNAAHNLLATMRVAALHGGLEQVGEHAVPPWRRLQIVPWDECIGACGGRKGEARPGNGVTGIPGPDSIRPSA